MVHETSAEDVLRHFCRSPRTRDIFEAWKSDERRRLVIPVVLGHRVRTVYRLRREDVIDVCRRTEHALGRVARRDGEAVHPIVDWHPDFAFTHMFHVCMEHLGALPTYQDFRNFSEGVSLGRDMLSNPARAKIHEAVAAGVPEALARAAMRWRVGNAYYSFLREVYTIMELRIRGVDLQMHPLADALFRVDCWTDRTAVSLRVGNSKFRKGVTQGRKTPAARILADLWPPVEFADIELRPASEFGSVHLPTHAKLDATAATLLGRP
ncbi:hypothetical protein [Streptomyces violascens]|uniref:hypothetical protein n=1 Tax=Streptomyces violascens TaxID=67381 RepID=UPI00365585C2